MTIERVTIADLVEDWDLYPRHSVDSAHVSALVEAIRSGDQLPLPLVEAGKHRIQLPLDLAGEGGHRIVDGFHRVRAFKRVLGETGIIEVNMREYANETEIVKDAIRLNASHGRKLDSTDRAKAVLMLQRRGVNANEIALTLHITEQRVETLKLRVAIVEDSTGHEETLAVKPILWPKGEEGPRRITTEQYQTQRSSAGLRPAQVISQLLRELRDRVLDLGDPALCARLWELHAEIERQVPTPEQRTA